MTAFLLALLEILLRTLLPALQAGATPTAEDGARQPLLRQRLVERIRSKWSVLCLLLCLFVVGLSGCRTVYVPAGEPVRLRETVKHAKVWVLDKTGQPVAGTMDLPEGWFCLPDPGEDVKQ